MVSFNYILFVVLVILPWSLATEEKQGTRTRYKINGKYGYGSVKK